MVTKTYGKDFNSEGGALTLPEDAVGRHKHVWRLHSSGWAIRGKLVEDWSAWVNQFEAVHPLFGTVVGDFETAVHADSEMGFNHFFEHHTPEAWDYQDI